MSQYEFISILVGLVAVSVSAFAMIFTGVQARRASQALLFAEQIEKGEAVAHFSGQFLQLIADGEPGTMVSNDLWAYRYWSLQSTEFYFFHHRILPPFIYTLWMADLAVLYAGSSGPTAIRTQRAFLKPYEECYPQMIRFFEGLQTIAAEETEVLNRNSRIAAYVQGWVRDNARNI
jgi:hypothetical protein